MRVTGGMESTHFDPFPGLFPSSSQAGEMTLTTGQSCASVSALSESNSDPSWQVAGPSAEVIFLPLVSLLVVLPRFLPCLASGSFCLGHSPHHPGSQREFVSPFSVILEHSRHTSVPRALHLSPHQDLHPVVSLDLLGQEERHLS